MRGVCRRCIINRNITNPQPFESCESLRNIMHETCYVITQIKLRTFGIMASEAETSKMS